MPKFVDIETPYNASDEAGIKRNILYARACVRDSLMRGENPYASHLFFTQPGILDDQISEERDRGIVAGKEIIEALPGIITVVYADLGISRGMQYGVDLAKAAGREVEQRLLGEDWLEKALEHSNKHSHAAIWGYDNTE